jgi:hypothetical protein
MPNKIDNLQVRKGYDAKSNERWSWGKKKCLIVFGIKY